MGSKLEPPRSYLYNPVIYRLTLKIKSNHLFNSRENSEPNPSKAPEIKVEEKQDDGTKPEGEEGEPKEEDEV